MGLKVILDCDPGVDDVLALLFLLNSQDVDLLAYIPQFGNTDAKDAYVHVGYKAADVDGLTR